MESKPDPRSHWLRKIFSGLSSTSVLTIIFLMIATMTGAYIWGVITGRQSETPIAEKAQPPQEANLEEARSGKILQAHELEFTQALRDEARKTKRDLQPESPPVQAAEVDKASPGNVEATPEQTVPAASEAPQANPGPQADSEADENAIYDYVFQVAALREAGAADNLRQTLEGEGLRTRLEQSGKLYIVLVLMRGAPTRVSELGDLALKLRLGNPMLRNKKPVSQRINAGPAAAQKGKEN